MAETIDATCFRCKACNNKIAMSQDYIRRDARTALFKKVVNVQTADPKDNWKRKGCTLANVFCGTHSCNKALGFRIVSAPHQKLIEGRVVLSLDRLLYWNGKKHSNPHLMHPENRFLFEFDETVVPHVYACRKCFAHIANSKDFISKINNLGWFKDVRNLLYNNSESRCENFVSGGTLRNEYCANCFSHLGGKIVAMKTPNPPLEEGNFLLMLAMLWYWNGEMMCDAEDHLMPAMNMQDPYLLLEGRTSEL